MQLLTEVRTNGTPSFFGFVCVAPPSPCPTNNIMGSRSPDGAQPTGPNGVSNDSLSIRQNSKQSNPNLFQVFPAKGSHRVNLIATELTLRLRSAAREGSTAYRTVHLGEKRPRWDGEAAMPAMCGVRLSLPLAVTHRTQGRTGRGGTPMTPQLPVIPEQGTRQCTPRRVSSRSSHTRKLRWHRTFPPAT